MANAGKISLLRKAPQSDIPTPPPTIGEGRSGLASEEGSSGLDDEDPSSGLASKEGSPDLANEEGSSDSANEEPSSGLENAVQAGSSEVPTNAENSSTTHDEELKDLIASLEDSAIHAHHTKRDFKHLIVSLQGFNNSATRLMDLHYEVRALGNKDDAVRLRAILKEKASDTIRLEASVYQELMEILALLAEDQGNQDVVMALLRMSARTRRTTHERLDAIGA